MQIIARNNARFIQLHGQSDIFNKFIAQLNNEIFRVSFPIQNSVQKMLMLSTVVQDLKIQEHPDGYVQALFNINYESQSRVTGIEFQFKKTLDHKFDLYCTCDCDNFEKQKKCEHVVFATTLVLSATGYFDVKKLIGRNYYICDFNMQMVQRLKDEFSQFDKYENPTAIVITPYCGKYLNGRDIADSDFTQPVLVDNVSTAYNQLVAIAGSGAQAPMVKPLFWGEQIQFVWRDYRVVNLREILQGKKCLSKELFDEVLELTRNYVSQDYDLILKITDFFLKKISYFPETHIQEIKKCSRILFGLTQFAQKHSIPLSFSPHCDFSHKRIVYPLKNIRFQSTPSVAAFSAQMATAENEVTQQPSMVFQSAPMSIPKSAFCFYDGYWDSESQEYVYYDLGPTYARLFDDLTQLHPTFYGVKNYEPNVTREVQFLSLHDGIQALEFLKHKGIDVKSELPPIHNLECDLDHVKINLHSNAGGKLVGYDFLLEVPIEGKKHVSFHLDQDLFAKILEEGLSALFLTDRKELASKSSIYRTNDLKFLRHIGSAVTFLLENLSYLLTDRTTDGKAFKQQNDFFRFLELRMLRCVYPKDDLEEFHISPNLRKRFFKSGLLDFLTQILNDTISKVISLPDIGLYQINISPDVFLQFAMVDLLYMIESQGPTLVTREKSDLWFHSFMYHFYQGGENGKLTNPCIVDFKNPVQKESQFKFPQVSGYDAWGWVTRISEAGVQIKMNHREIEALGVDDLETQFELRENTNQDAQTNNQWFELNPEVFFKGKKVQWGEVDIKPGRRFIEYQGQLFMIDSRTLPRVEALMQFWEQIESKSSKLRTGEKHNYYLLPKHAILELLHLHQSGIQIKGGKEWEMIVEFYEGLEHPERRQLIEIPERLRPILKDYQKSGYQWLYDLYHLKLGALLADDMGLGKTIQTLCFLERLRLENKLGLCLIVVPTSLVYNWISEAERFAPELPIHVLTAQTKSELLKNDKVQEPLVLVTTYGLMVEHEEMIHSQKYNILIFDEAQNLKNLSSQRTTVARKLSANFKLALTGTPLENHYGEFFSLIDLVLPGAMGDYATFIRRCGLKADVLPDIEFLNHIRKIMKPILLRRTKKDVGLNLPPKVESVRPLDMEEKQRTLYRNIAVAMNEKVKELIDNKGESFAQLEMLTALLRLRQICSDPAAVPGIDYPELSPKIQSLVEEVEEVVGEGESVLVFTQFLSTLHRIEGELKARGVEYRLIIGETPRVAREAILRDFQSSPKPMALIMTLKTGGVGLNLTKASRVFHVEPWWNPAVENQATDRAHRLGQERDVNVVRFIMKDTVEERIQVLKDLKGQKFSALFESEEFNAETFKNAASSNFLSKSDFQQLLSLK